MKYRSSGLFTLVISSLLYGCASFTTGPGDKPAEIPPKIVIGENNTPIWDRPEAFGPVPEELKATGDKICKNDGAREAIGYHPRAIHLNGQPFKGGGYLCGGAVDRCNDENDKRDYCRK